MISPKRQMSEADAIQILQTGKYGVLSTSTLDGIPYGVPLNYFYVQEDNAIYFQSMTALWLQVPPLLLQIMRKK
jgi:nitroimidazol reductase NimA-like FMN-containing flavoprotein (pyridoxamine 5'-phosphate oxidase superfamily)